MSCLGLVWAALIAGIVIVCHPGAASAQIYRWTDADGTIHYSQGIESVPARFRDQAAIIGYDRPAPLPLPPSSPSPAPSGPGGGARVRFTPGQPIMVQARINGAISAELMLDTGAARTVIHPKVLESVGVSYRDAQRGSLRGVTGDAEVVAVKIESIDVSGATYGPLVVVSHDTGFGRGDGLLGRDFLDHFSVNIDNGGGVVTLVPK
jgi:predicted aspartyl protease